jgi:hypothetical protein
MPTNNAGHDTELVKVRKRIFRLLLFRMRRLRLRRPIPNAFYIGQPYVEDKRKVNCIITANFVFPGYIEDFDFWLHGAHVFGTQIGNAIQIQAHGRISQQLWEDIKYLGEGEQFIIGYLAPYMPIINRKILDTRYYQGHILARTFSLFEALDVSLIVNPELVYLRWPSSVLPFPPSAALAKNVNALYVHDYIDAINSYFRADYDDCIRRVITSAENLFEARQWKRTHQSSLVEKLLRIVGISFTKTPNTFRRTLASRLHRDRISGQVINDNLQYVYTVRNRIVHAGFRLSTSSEQFCAKAIVTLKHLISGYCADKVIARYADTLNMQFEMQRSMLVVLNNLDIIEKKMAPVVHTVPVHSSPQALNKALFEALRFTEVDKHSIAR